MIWWFVMAFCLLALIGLGWIVGGLLGSVLFVVAGVIVVLGTWASESRKS
jgi:hypothetical protein